MSSRLIQFVLALALVAGVAGFVVYDRFVRVVAVQSVEVVRKPLDLVVVGTGSLQPALSATIASEIQGRLVELAVDDGDRVSFGDVLALIDDVDLQRAVDVAKADMETVEAAIERFEADIDRARAVLENANADFTRVREALDRGAANVTEFDSAGERVSIANAEMARAIAALREGQKRQISAERALDAAVARLDDAVIRAPFDGLIVRRDRDPGDVVTPGASIYRLVGLDDIRVSAWVDESSMADLHPGQHVDVVFRSEPEERYPGSVFRLGREVDPETREFIVEVTLDKLPENWAVGQRAETMIHVRRIEDSLSVPQQFVVIRDGETGVFIDELSRAQWREINVGARSGAMVEVRDGLEPGMRVVRPADSNQRGLRSGQRIDER